MGIEIESPDVNYSEWDFEIEDHIEEPSAIRFGLGAIKNVGFNPVEIIMNARKNGVFTDINDFARRVDLRKVGRRALESMICVGALDSFGSRCEIMEGINQIAAVSESHFRAKECGQLTFFGTVEGLQEEIILPKTTTYNKKVQLEWEKELLGLYLSDHPLSAYLSFIKGRITHYSSQLVEVEHKSEVIVGGSIEDTRTIITKKGDEMAFARLADIQGNIELVIFPRTWKKYSDQIRKDEVLFVKGTVDTERSVPKILVDFVEKIDLDKFSVNEPYPSESDTAQVDIGSNNGRHGNSDLITETDPWNGHEFSNTSSAKNISKKSAGGEYAEVDKEHNSRIELEDAGEGYQPLIETHKTKKCKVIEITLNSTGSKQKDTRRLRKIYGFLISIPGNDQFAFLCRENGQTYRFDFPNDSTAVNDSLINELSGMVGESNVWVSP